jgi:hypothetical protein
MITTVTDIGAQAATKHVVALAYLAVVCRLAGRAETPPGFGNRTPHFGVLASSTRFLTLRTPVAAVSSIALALFGQTFAFVCTPLALVGRLLAIVGDPFPLVGEAVSSVGSPLAPVDLALSPRERLLTLVRLALRDRGVVANHPTY